ncbi:hypothetical protein Pmani_031570 [Petrolisthes manimaculis]|uniref:Uncharacterized protein n=1 Tax=Petrolisthes manimaculis TaxID=1843537 RepID=A0AAE1NVL9_9EUCA|nr:hypothetical protein Pmani_031570 [Petrolisthes manimaculis]
MEAALAKHHKSSKDTVKQVQLESLHAALKATVKEELMSRDWITEKGEKVGLQITEKEEKAGEKMVGLQITEKGEKARERRLGYRLQRKEKRCLGIEEE